MVSATHMEKLFQVTYHITTDGSSKKHLRPKLLKAQDVEVKCLHKKILELLWYFHVQSLTKVV